MLTGSRLNTLFHLSFIMSMLKKWQYHGRWASTCPHIDMGTSKLNKDKHTVLHPSKGPRSLLWNVFQKQALFHWRESELLRGENSARKKNLGRSERNVFSWRRQKAFWGKKAQRVFWLLVNRKQDSQSEPGKHANRKPYANGNAGLTANGRPFISHLRFQSSNVIQFQTEFTLPSHAPRRAREEIAVGGVYKLSYLFVSFSGQQKQLCPLNGGFCLPQSEKKTKAALKLERCGHPRTIPAWMTLRLCGFLY